MENKLFFYFYLPPFTLYYPSTRVTSPPLPLPSKISEITCLSGDNAIPKDEVLDKIQTKVFRVFLLVNHCRLYGCAWDFYFFKITQPLRVSVKEKAGKPDRKPYPLPYGLRNTYKNLKSENSQDYAQKPQRDCTFMNSASVFSLAASKESKGSLLITIKERGIL